MAQAINPFHELYVTETISSEDFVDVFSDTLVGHTLELFQAGNVILRGVQGSGKSMLLNLLRPEIRLAYAKVGRDFPVPDDFGVFIGGGINLTRSGAIAFGQRPIEDDIGGELDRLPLYFGDFLNYYIVRDILKSVSTLRSGLVGPTISLLVSQDQSTFDKFALALASAPCWFGFLAGVRSLKDLEERISRRLDIYRNFFNYNINAIPADVRTSKTAIGDPISVTAETLWDCGVVPRTVPFYIRIDQYEQLHDIEGPADCPHLGQVYANTVNRLLGTRESRVSYRIGVRHYAWRQAELRIFGTTSVLEKERNYRVVDLDKLLRRSEKTSGLFPTFAEDVFRQRVAHAGYSIGTEKQLLKHVLGSEFPAEQKLKSYVRSSPEAVIDSDPDWPPEVDHALRQLALDDPLQAKLGEAWVRQKMKRKQPELPSVGVYPWQKKPYWKKERIQQALMQIAARRGQRLVWGGMKETIALAGGNILIFVSICQQVWAAWLRSIRETEQITSSELPKIDLLTQNEGIQLASSYWHEKITELPGGHERQRFVDLLARIFVKRLLADKAMSNPGFNGFSVQIDELETDETVKRFLEDAVNYAALEDRPHTTKNKDRIRRRKWYVNPIFSVYYQLPVVRTKEPIYAKVSDVREWLVEANILSQPTRRPTP